MGASFPKQTARLQQTTQEGEMKPGIRFLQACPRWTQRRGDQRPIGGVDVEVGEDVAEFMKEHLP